MDDSVLVSESVVGNGCGGGEGGEGSAQRNPRLASRLVGGESSSLECLRNTVREEEERKEEDHIHIIGNRCRSWFCQHCASVQGPRLRFKLINQVEHWRNPMMLTFTVDPQFFESPQVAFKWVTEQRAIARVMKLLKRFLNRSDWFCVIEWHESGWPHWHLLCDSSRIPIEKVREAWARFVPKHLRHLIRPKIGSLGIVRFSKPDGFKSAKHAGLYVSKYLTKYPEKGFPSWVMEARYRIRRYTTSRGFWGKMSHRTVCESEDESDGRQPRSHAERQKQCCKSCTVYRVIEKPDESTGELVQERRFKTRIACNGFLLANIVKEWIDVRDDVQIFVRGCFVDWHWSWEAFCEFFKPLVEGSFEAEFAGMRLVAG